MKKFISEVTFRRCAMRSMFIGLILSCSLVAPLAWAGFDEGVQAYKNKDYAKAMTEFRPLAEQGNASAQYNLGQIYRQGEGVLQDDAEAVKWYRLAAEKGDADAQNNLGIMYFLGLGVMQDYKEAEKWYHLSAVAAANASSEKLETIGAATDFSGKQYDAQPSCQSAAIRQQMHC